MDEKLKTWKTNSSKSIVDSDWVKVRKDTMVKALMTFM